MKVEDLTGAQLDYWVAKAEDEYPVWINAEGKCEFEIDAGHTGEFAPSTDWEQGGRIIERERITVLSESVGLWRAGFSPEASGMGIAFIEESGDGPTPLIAAMRAYVASKLGAEVLDTP